MALSLFPSPDGNYTLISGYESGHTTVATLSPTWAPTHTYISNPHTQPILSLSVSPAHEYYFTSAADAVIAKHPIPLSVIGKADVAAIPLKVIKTGHSGQQGLRVRNDGKIFATAGWDGRVRVYSGKSMKELAVLKWHKEGVYAVAFADVEVEEEEEEKELVGGERALSVREERERKAERTHWVAAGSKDGKVSLWEVY